MSSIPQAGGWPRAVPVAQRRRRLRWVLVGAAVLAIAASAVVWFARPAAVPAVRPVTRPVTQSLAATGRVTGAQETAVAPDQAGVLTELQVEEGDRVNAGQLLAQLQNEVESAQLDQAEAAVRTAEAQLREARAPARASEIAQAEAETRSAVSQAQGRLEAAQERLRELQSGGTTAQRQEAAAQVRQAEARVAQAQREVARAAALSESSATARAPLQQARAALTAAEARVDQARGVLEKAERDLGRSGRLVAEGAIPRAQYEDAQTTARSARRELDAAVAARDEARVEVARQERLLDVTRRTELQRAQAELEQAREALAAARARQRQIGEGARPEVLAQVQAEIAAARQAVAAAREAGRARVESLSSPRPERVAVAAEQLEEARRAREAAAARLRATQVTAPYGGIVTEILARPGASVGPSQPVLRVSQIQAPEVRVDVDERNLRDIRVGQPAILTADAYPGRSLEAKVTAIAPRADPQRGTVEVVIQPTSVPDWLRTGLTVDANIIIAQSDEHLVVPTTAVIRRADRTLVRVIDDGRVVERSVVVGEGGREGTIVLSGLKPTDWVVVQSTSVEPGQRARPVPARKTSSQAGIQSPVPAGTQARLGRPAPNPQSSVRARLHTAPATVLAPRSAPVPAGLQTRPGRPAPNPQSAIRNPQSLRGEA